MSSVPDHSIFDVRLLRGFRPRLMVTTAIAGVVAHINRTWGFSGQAWLFTGADGKVRALTQATIDDGSARAAGIDENLEIHGFKPTGLPANA